MSVLDELLNHEKWLEFLAHKESFYMYQEEYDSIKEFIEKKKYYDISKQIIEGKYTFSIPRKKFINKSWTTKKRIVYTYKYNEMIILKMIHYLLKKYDYLLAPNCYSFRGDISPKQAFYNITNYGNLNFGYKVDIHNYFNSISIDRLLNMLKGKIDDKVYYLFYQLLTNDKVSVGEEIVSEQKGVMAGTPLSCFLSNIYLSELDFYFVNKKYARYADDIIIFADTKEELNEMVDYIHTFFKKYDLEINHDKEHYYENNAKFEFLGFSYDNGVIDLSDKAVLKMKAKIRRKSRALRRWKLRKDIPPINSMKALNNIFNYKFYHEDKNKELNWSIWYFPTINTDQSLKVIDAYYQQYLRYIATGKHCGKKYWNIRYNDLKKSGYRSLVHEYYEYKNKQ